MNYIKGYLSAMEHGRLELMRALGWAQERLMLECQCALMIGTLEAKYLRQAFLGDKLVIEGTIESSGLCLKYSFQIWKNETGLIFQGDFSMPLVDMVSGKMIKNSPGWILETA
jgi:acyl-CoA thioesterase FadM